MRTRLRFAFLLLLWAGGTGVAAAMPGCYGRNCEGDAQVWGDDPGEGSMLDDNTWESGPQDGKWIFFPRQRFWRFDLRVLGGRTPAIVIPYVSANEEPNKVFQSSTIGGGNLAEIFDVHENTVTIHNGTCSDYYLRVVVVAGERPPETASDAGSTDAQAADVTVTTDAAADAPKDAEAGP